MIYVYSMCLADGEKLIFLRSAIRRALHKEGSRNQESSTPDVDPSRTARNKAGGLTAGAGTSYLVSGQGGELVLGLSVSRRFQIEFASVMTGGSRQHHGIMRSHFA